MLSDLFEGLGVAAADRVILGAFAHPDDEAFTCGGTLASTAANGGRVQLLCATRGEVGEISDVTLATPDTLGEVREVELREACRILGISPPIFLDFRDSGMHGTPPNEHESSLHQADLDEVTRLVIEAIRRERPQVVLTFDPNGGYGHPDHIAIHKATVAAFGAAADGSKYPEQVAAGLAPHAAARLFYIAIPRSSFERLMGFLRSIGINPADAGFGEGRVGMPDDEINARVAVHEYVGRKEQAFLAHRTQIGPGSIFMRMPREMLLEAMGLEHFVLAAGQGADAP